MVQGKLFLANVELYHGVKRGARNGIDTSDWLEIIFSIYPNARILVKLSSFGFG